MPEGTGAHGRRMYSYLLLNQKDQFHSEINIQIQALHSKYYLSKHNIKMNEEYAPLSVMGLSLLVIMSN